MTIVALALRRPITVIVMVLALAMAGLWAAQETPKDILPQLGIPT
jgi:multidrug efflux pump subunit AcrB